MLGYVRFVLVMLGYMRHYFVAHSANYLLSTLFLDSIRHEFDLITSTFHMHLIQN